jgi:hypothetical protein
MSVASAGLSCFSWSRETVCLNLAPQGSRKTSVYDFVRSPGVRGGVIADATVSGLTELGRQSGVIVFESNRRDVSGRGRKVVLRGEGRDVTGVGMICLPGVVCQRCMAWSDVSRSCAGSRLPCRQPSIDKEEDNERGEERHDVMCGGASGSQYGHPLLDRKDGVRGLERHCRRGIRAVSVQLDSQSGDGTLRWSQQRKARHLQTSVFMGLKDGFDTIRGRVHTPGTSLLFSD